MPARSSRAGGWRTHLRRLPIEGEVLHPHTAFVPTQPSPSGAASLAAASLPAAALAKEGVRAPASDQESLASEASAQSLCTCSVLSYR
jgi:hypothetical protein